MHNSASIFPTPEGLVLAHTTIARRNDNGQFEVNGREEEIRLLLSIAYGKAISSQAMRHITRAAELLQYVSTEELKYAGIPLHLRPADALPATEETSPLAKALLHIALTGLNYVENERQYWHTYSR